jgi:hypothetical protein
VSNITRIARKRELKFRLNRPSSISFEVPSNDRLVSDLWSGDQRPLLEEGTRTVKAFRKELDGDGSTMYRLRFNGTVETIQDQGDPDNCKTTVAAFSPFYDLARRMCLGDVHDVYGATPFLVSFTNTDGAQIAKTLLDRTNAAKGNTGITTDGGTFETVNTFTVTYQYTPVGQAITDMCDAFNGFDIYEEPIDTSYGAQTRLHCLARRGTYKQDLFFGWGIAPHNIQTMTRLKDRSTLANVIYGLGAGSGIGLQHTPPYSDATSITTYRTLEVADNLADVGNQMIAPLVQEELSFRKVPREIVQWVPQRTASDLFAFKPFDTYDCGDTVNVAAGKNARGGFTGIQRVYGFDLGLDEEAVERVTAVYTSPETS